MLPTGVAPSPIIYNHNYYRNYNQNEILQYKPARVCLKRPLKYFTLYYSGVKEAISCIKTIFHFEIKSPDSLPSPPPCRSWMNPSEPAAPEPLLVRPPTILMTLPRSNPPPSAPSSPAPAAPDLAELMIPMKPLRRAGSSPLSSACCRRELPPLDWTMETTFCTLSSCFPDRAPSREPTSSLLPPSYTIWGSVHILQRNKQDLWILRKLTVLPPYCSSRSSALSLTKLLQHNSLWRVF